MTSPNFKVLVHVQDIGDITVGPNEYAGACGKNKTLEGFQINFSDSPGLGLRYMAHVAENGDTGWLNDGDFVGNRGEKLPLQGFAIQLTGEKSTEYDVVYKAYDHRGGETAWCANGDFCGTRGQVLNLDAIVVKLVPKFAVLVHVEGAGDITVGPNEYAGMRGQKKPLDGFQLDFAHPADLGLRYMVHVANTGDTRWFENGQFAGGRDQHAPLQGFAIKLTGDKSAEYDVFYMAYNERGETAWCSNGDFCGTRGESRSLVAIVVKLVRKISVLVHVQTAGDMTFGPNEYAGARGKNKTLEGFQINFSAPVGLGLRYMANIAGKGDTGWVKDGEFVGSRGKAAPMRGFAIELTGENFARYDVFYMAYRHGGGETAWFSNGTFCGAHDKSDGLDAIVVKIVKRAPNYVSIVSKARSESGRMLLITGRPTTNQITVDAPGDENWQTWDKRLVQGGRGYLLISKAAPTQCIARRGRGEPTVLVDIRSAKLDDCTWRDDTVPGTYNAINCWTDWELKLNMRGQPPYRDRDTALQTWQWDRAANNELWRTTVQTYNVVAGGDETALNKVAEAIYRGCYPRVFRASLDVGRDGLTTVGFDMTTTPVFSLAPSPLFQRQLDGLHDLSVEEKALFQHAAAASFSARVDCVKLKVGGKISAEVDARLDASAAIRFDPDNRLTIHLKTGELHIGEGQIDEGVRIALEIALNLAFLPLLLGYLNENILDRISIPKLDLNGIQFAAPVISVQHPYLLGTTSIAPDLAAPPPPSFWPERRVFCGVDASTLDTVAASFLKEISQRGRWSCDLGITTVRAEYHLEFENPKFIVTAGAGNTYKLRINVAGGASFSFSTFLGDIKISARMDGFAQATASVVVTPDRKVKIVFRSLDDANIDLDFDSLPFGVSNIVDLILKAFTPFIKEVVTLALRDKEFDVYTIPEIDATIGGRRVTITLQGLALDSMQDQARKPLLLASGDVDVKLH